MKKNPEFAKTLSVLSRREADEDRVYAKISYINCDNFYTSTVSLYNSPEKTEESCVLTKTVSDAETFEINPDIIEDFGRIFVYVLQ